MALKLSKKNNKIQKVVKKQTVVRAQKQTATPIVASDVVMPTGKFVEATGRRKVASARVRLYEGGGDFVVNGKIAGNYFATINNAAARFNKPFDLTGTKGKFGVSVKVAGSGIMAQLEATMHGISRALVSYDPAFRPLLKPEGLLTRDDRMKETRKIGSGGKARRKRQSPKR
jgi:small subunit ribosomal protein S9